MKKEAARNEICTLIHKLAARPQGVAVKDGPLHGYTRDQFSNAFTREMAAGRVFNARLGYKTSLYFTTKEAADRAMVAGKSVVHAGTVSVPSARSKAPWTKDTPPHYPKHANGKPAYKVTICPPTKAGEKTNTHPQ